MSDLADPALAPLFQPEPGGPVRALLVAGALGNVGFGKLGQLARLLVPRGIPVVALDVSPAVEEIPGRLREAYGDRFDAAAVDRILAGVTVVRGTPGDLPAGLNVGFVFEAIPERLPLKHALYREIRARDPEAFIFSATSGFPSTALFEGLPGAERCGVMHPFFPHLTNKLWEVPVRDAVTGGAEMKTIRRFLARLGMNVVPVRDVPSFAADRIFCGMMLEAVRIHAGTGLSPAAIDDACKGLLGTSPFFVHNLIRGANGLSAHCMQLLGEEIDSTLFAIPDAWTPYIEDPDRKWPYERGQRCPPEARETVQNRMLGMLLSLTAAMVDREIVGLDALCFLCENALAFREGTPAIAKRLGFEEARRIVETFVRDQGITRADEVAPVSALSADRPGWDRIYVDTSVRDGVGLVSLKRAALSDTFLAELDAAWERLQADPAVTAMVIAPDGVYSRELGHGADLQAFVPVLGKHDAALGLIQRWKRTLGKLRSGKPTVAAMVGRVLGGSLELAASCHARIAGAETRLQFPETTVGVIPGLGGCHHVHRLTDPEAWPRIDALLLSGHGFSAEEAKGWGFVSAVVPIRELPTASMTLAADLGAGRIPLPPFREGPFEHTVDRGAPTTNQAGVTLDAELRELLADTIEQANALPWADASRLEEEAAARSLTLSSSAIGVKAMLRGKPPKFEHPL